jgi:hypothetical protein
LVGLPWITREALTGSAKTQTVERRKFSWFSEISSVFAGKILKEFQSLQGGQIFNFSMNLHEISYKFFFLLSGTFNATFSHIF